MSTEAADRTADERPAGAEGEAAAAPGSNEDTVKIILLGDSAVGKSKLVERFLMDDHQPQQLSTYALTLFRHNAEVEGKPIAVDFWDTAGQERFQNLHPSYFHGAHCCVLVFDCTRKVTYTNLSKWYSELQENRYGIPVVVVANKIDVDYRVTRKNFAFASKRNLPFFFVSASDGTNVVQLFTEAIRLAVDCKQNPPAGDFVQDVLDLLGDK